MLPYLLIIVCASFYIATSRAVWFAIILTSFICASLLVNTMWTRFRMSPTMTAVKDTHLPLYSLPFPAVSVCSTDKIKRNEAYVYLSKYENYALYIPMLFLEICDITSHFLNYEPIVTQSLPTISSKSDIPPRIFPNFYFFNLNIFLRF